MKESKVYVTLETSKTKKQTLKSLKIVEQQARKKYGKNSLEAVIAHEMYANFLDGDCEVLDGE